MADKDPIAGGQRREPLARPEIHDIRIARAARQASDGHGSKLIARGLPSVRRLEARSPPYTSPLSADHRVVWVCWSWRDRGDPSIDKRTSVIVAGLGRFVRVRTELLPAPATTAHRRLQFPGS